MFECPLPTCPSSCLNFPSLEDNRRRLLLQQQFNNLPTISREEYQKTEKKTRRQSSFDAGNESSHRKNIQKVSKFNSNQRLLNRVEGGASKSLMNDYAEENSIDQKYSDQKLSTQYRQHNTRRIQASGKCVRTATELKTAVSKGSTKINVCTSRIKLGSAVRRLDHSVPSLLLQKRRTRGIDLSNKNIVFVCRNPMGRRCQLDGEGQTRIFYGNNATVTFLNIEFNNGYNTQAGGALNMNKGSMVRLTNCSFSNNTATTGSAISVNNSNLVIDGIRSAIIDNKGNGAPISIHSSKANLENVLFRRNDRSKFVSIATCLL